MPVIPAMAEPPCGLEFRSPADLAFDRDGDLFVSDAGNRAIRELVDIGQPDQSTTVVLGPASAGQFGKVATGGSSSAQAFTLTNSSGVSLTGLAVTITGADPLDFSQSNTCGSSLAASATCNINVIFNPTNVGARSATLQVTDSDPSSPQTAALTGFGDDFEVSARTGSADDDKHPPRYDRLPSNWRPLPIRPLPAP